MIKFKKSRTKKIVNFSVNHWRVILLTSLLFTTFLSFTLSLNQNIWFDEGYSIFVAQQPINKLISLVAVDAHPPAYYIVLKAWGSLWHWNEFALRLLSMLFATSAIGMVFLIIKKVSNAKTATLVLPFLVFAPFALRYSYEIRPYAMTSLIVTGATLALLYAVHNKNYKYWALYAVLVTLGMLTLYMSAAVWIGHALWLVYKSWNNKKTYPIKPWLLSYIFSILLFLPWLPTFFVQYTNSALPGIGQSMNLNTIAETSTHLLSYSPGWRMHEINAFFVLLTLFLVTVLLIRNWDKKNKIQRSNLIFIGFLTIVPFLVLMILNALSAEKFYISRYIAHFSIFYYMALGFIIVTSYKYSPRTSTTTGILLILILLNGIINLATIGNYNFERSQKPAIYNFAKTLACDNTTTIVTQDEYTYLDSFFYFKDCNLKFLKEGEVSTRGGYAPLHNSKNQIQHISEVKTPNLIFISWKDKNNTKLFNDTFYTKISTQLYEKHQIEYYQKR